ncbi:MAG TPA: energy-coupling factor ABC transporter permease [Clostridiales bacterium]|nr:energy-coupling factor ABC transporter permease [Clostridiales bacterium]
MFKWTKKEKRIMTFSVMIAALLATSQTVYAMHIMEGYLSAAYCIAWGAVSIPFLVAGVISIRHTVQKKRRALILLAMAGAYIFVLSSLKIPSVTGSCSHMTGTGLSAILFGPMATSVLGIIVLLFQAILLAHGGLTTLGANTFSMAIAGPIFSFLLYKAGIKFKLNRKVNVFIAVALGDLFTYCVTSMQLAMAYPSESGGVAASALKFLAVFAPTQVPLAVIEGILTVIIVMGMESFAAPELKEVGFIKEGN